MIFVLLGLILIIFILSGYLVSLRKSLSGAVEQMEEIERHPERNRQLKAISPDAKLEELLNSINDIYQARQKERILYLKSETKIRNEIENISHDLRTPLTSILGYLELIKDCSQEEERAEYLDIIQKRAKVLQGYIQDFYEISRIEGEDYPLSPEVIDIRYVLKETMAAYYYEFEAKKLEVRIDLEEKPVCVLADKVQLHRIINNLIQNALKYAKEKFILRQFRIEGSCVIQFMNDKTMVSDKEIGLLFERFYTGNQARNNQGTGLGLTITKLLTQKMNGTIEARTEDDLFIIELRWPGKQED